MPHEVDEEKDRDRDAPPLRHCRRSASGARSCHTHMAPLWHHYGTIMAPLMHRYGTIMLASTTLTSSALTPSALAPTWHCYGRWIALGPSTHDTDTKHAMPAAHLFIADTGLQRGWNVPPMLHAIGASHLPAAVLGMPSIGSGGSSGAGGATLRAIRACEGTRRSRRHCSDSQKDGIENGEAALCHHARQRWAI